MTRLFKLFALSALCFAGLTARAGDTASLTGTVMSNASVKACVQTAKQLHPGLQTVIQSQNIAHCFAGGSLNQVTIMQMGHCPGNDLTACMPVAFLVATADVGCEGEVTNVVCYVN